MTGRNNHNNQYAKRVPHYGLRKLSIGVASVLLSTSFYLGASQLVVKADTNSAQVTNSQSEKTGKTDQSEPNTAAIGEQDDQAASPAAQSHSSTPSSTAQSNSTTAENNGIPKATTSLNDQVGTDNGQIKVTSQKVEQVPGNDKSKGDTGQTHLSLKLNIPQSQMKKIKSGDYIDVKLGLPYTTSDGQQHIMSYGAINGKADPIVIPYQGGIAGYIVPVGNLDKYAQTFITNDQKETVVNDNTKVDSLGTSNGYYQIIFTDGIKQYLVTHPSESSDWEFGVNLTWYNAIQNDDKKLDLPAGFTIYTNGDDTSDFTPNKDLQVGDYKTNSGIQFKVAKLNDSDAISFSNETRASNHTGNVAAHRWFQQNGTWYLASDTDTQQSVGISLSKTNNGHDLGKSFDITVSKPATDANSPITMDFVGYDSVQKQLQDAIVGEIKGNYNVDPIDGSDQYYLNHQVEYTQPNVTVTSKLSSDGNTITYTVTIDGDYEGFKSNADNDGKKDFIMTLINWKPKDEYDLLPPDNITNPTQDSGNATYPDNSDTYLNGNPIKSQAIKDFLKDKPWTLKVSTTNGDHLSQQTTGYWIDQSTDVKPENNGYVSGLFYEWAKQTIKFVDENGNQVENGGQKIDDHVNNAVFESDTNDFTNVNPQHFDDINVPQIDGYTAYVGVTDNNQLQMNNDKAVTNGQAVTTYGEIDLKPNDNVVEYVVYKADQQKATVTYIDDTTGKTLQTKTLSGVSDSDSGYNTKDTIAYYKGQKYTVVSDNTYGKNIVFDDDVSTDQSYEVHLTHTMAPISDSKTITETIHYVDEQGNKVFDDHQASVNFTRSGQNDQVTNTDNWNDWQPGASQNFTAVKSPEKAGYTPDIAVVETQTVTPSSDNIEKTVIYKADQQKATVKYIDDVTGQTLQTKDLFGASDSDSGYNTKATIADYEGQKYELVSDSTKGNNVVFDHDDNQDQTYEVHLTHATIPINGSKTVKETIHYVDEQGNKVFDDHQASVNFTRSGQHDQVTNTDHWNGWQPGASQSFTAVKSPEKAGYTPNIVTVEAQVVTPSSDNIEKTVIYKADLQKATVKYIDDTTGQALQTKTLSGASDSDSGYNTKATIADYVSQKYKFVSDNTDGKNIVFDHDDSTDQSYEVHLTHTTNPISDSKTITETIHYVDEQGNKVFDDHQASVKFTRSGQHDQVTNTDNWDTWQPGESQSFTAVKSPEKAGYTPDIATIEAQTVTPSSKNIEKTVVYKADQQKATVKYIDDTTGKTLQTKDLTGPSDSDSGYNTNDTITYYKGQNYELVSDSTKGNNVVFDHDDSTDQTYEVHLTHNTTPISDSKTITETIHYVDEQGNKVFDDHQASVNFTRRGQHDQVTNTDNWNGWQPGESQNFTSVKSPEKAGYTPNIVTVEAHTVTPSSDDIEKTVIYKADQQKATVKYIDDTTGKTLQTKDLTGASDSDSGYNTKDTIADYEGQNYELVSDSTDGNNVVFDHDDSVDQSYKVHLKHGTVNWTENKTVTETIHYIYQNGPHAGETAAKDYTAKREFTRTNTVDNVTGKVVSYGEWNTVDPFSEVASPVIDGYTSDRTMVGPMSVDPDLQNIVVDVYYTMNVNPDNPNNPVIPTPDNPTPNNGDNNHQGSNGQQSNTGNNSSSQASDKQLPQTGDSEKSTLGLGLAALMSTLGLGFRKKRNN